MDVTESSRTIQAELVEQRARAANLYRVTINQKAEIERLRRENAALQSRLRDLITGDQRGTDERTGDSGG